MQLCGSLNILWHIGHSWFTVLFKFSFFFDFLPVVLLIIENNLLMSLVNIIKVFLAPFHSISFANIFYCYIFLLLFSLLFFIFFLLYNIVFVLPYINMNLPWVYISSLGLLLFSI